jgi:hypothetical protein
MVLISNETLFLTSLKNYAILTPMIKPDPSLDPEWDEDNINHIAKHGLTPEQIEEVYYGEGPHPTLALINKKGMGEIQENRYRLWGTDAADFFIEAVIAPYPGYGVWRCVTAFPMSSKTRRVYLKRIKK